MFSEKVMRIFCTWCLVFIPLVCSAIGVKYCPASPFIRSYGADFDKQGAASRQRIGSSFIINQRADFSAYILDSEHTFRRELEQMVQIWQAFSLLDKEWHRSEIYYMRLHHLRLLLQNFGEMLDYTAQEYGEVGEFTESISVFVTNCLGELRSDRCDRKRLRSLLLSIEYLMQQRFVIYTVTNFYAPSFLNERITGNILVGKFYSSFIYVNYFRWTSMARERIDSSFLFPDCSDRELFRHLLHSQCFEEREDGSFFELCGRLTIPHQDCEYGLYYEIIFDKDHEIEHLLFEID